MTVCTSVLLVRDSDCLYICITVIRIFYFHKINVLHTSKSFALILCFITYKVVFYFSVFLYKFLAVVWLVQISLTSNKVNLLVEEPHYTDNSYFMSA